MRKTLIATVLLGLAASASATAISWGPHDAPAESNLAYVSSGSFSDVYSFSLASAEQTTSSVVSLNLLSIYAITGGNYSLFMDTGAAGPDAGDALEGSWSFDGTTGSTSHTVNLAAGNYYYVVTGMASGTGDGARNAGIYNIASTITPVPEPESYALMLAGLAVMGGICSRRSKRN